MSWSFVCGLLWKPHEPLVSQCSLRSWRAGSQLYHQMLGPAKVSHIADEPWRQHPTLGLPPLTQGHCEASCRRQAPYPALVPPAWSVIRGLAFQRQKQGWWGVSSWATHPHQLISFPFLFKSCPSLRLQINFYQLYSIFWNHPAPAHHFLEQTFLRIEIRAATETLRALSWSPLFHPLHLSSQNHVH